MPLKTSLACPHCKHVGLTDKPISGGAKVRCAQCGLQFRYAPPGSDPDEELRTVGDMELGKLSEFFTPETTTPKARKNDQEDDRYHGITNEPFIPNPLAPASERSKDVFIGGKEVRVRAGRRKMAVVLTFLVLLVGYGGAVSMHGLMGQLEGEGAARKKAQEKAEAALREKAGGPNTAEAKPKSKTKAIPKEVPKVVMPTSAPVPARPRTKAGDPLTIGDLEVRVLKRSAECLIRLKPSRGSRSFCESRTAPSRKRRMSPGPTPPTNPCFAPRRPRSLSSLSCPKRKPSGP